MNSRIGYGHDDSTINIIMALLGCTAVLCMQMWHIVIDGVARFVCLLVMIVSLAKTAKPIEMPFGLWTWVGPKNHVLDGVQIPHENGQL